MHGDASRAILIVDDETDLTRSLAAVFRRHDYDVRVVHAAEQAMETVANWQPALAIVDIVLPKMSGIELSGKIREIHPDCRIVLFSSDQTPQTLLEEAAHQGHLFEILAKPVHPLFMLDYVSSRLVGRIRRTA